MKHDGKHRRKKTNSVSSAGLSSLVPRNWNCNFPYISFAGVLTFCLRLNSRHVALNISEFCFGFLRGDIAWLFRAIWVVKHIYPLHGHQERTVFPIVSDVKIPCSVWAPGLFSLNLLPRNPCLIIRLLYARLHLELRNKDLGVLPCCG